MARAALERRVVRALDDHHVEADATDPQPADRIAFLQRMRVNARIRCHAPLGSTRSVRGASRG